MRGILVVSNLNIVRVSTKIPKIAQWFCKNQEHFSHSAFCGCEVAMEAAVTEELTY